MKKIKILSWVAVLSLGMVLSCRDEALNPTLEPEFGAYAKGQFINQATNTEIPLIFDGYSQNAVNAVVFWDKVNTNETTATTNVKVQVTWNAGKETVVINKIEIYVQFIESYADKNANVIIRSHGPASSPSVPEGKLWKTIDAGARLAPAAYTITPADLYNLYKGTTFDYKGTGTPVDIFESNPGYPRKVSALNTNGNRFLASRTDQSGTGKTLAADNISLKWRLLGSDGRAYGSWHNNVCTQLTDANCSVLFVVK